MKKKISEKLVERQIAYFDLLEKNDAKLKKFLNKSPELIEKLYKADLSTHPRVKKATKQLESLIEAISFMDSKLEERKQETKAETIVIDLPINLKPEREVWEKLGFIFAEDDEVSDKYHVMLPKEWTTKKKTNKNSSEEVLNIYDENHNLRGEVAYRHAELKTRYSVYLENVNAITDVVYFGDEENKLYSAVINNPNETKRHLGRTLARQWAYENYPDWNDVTAYWDVENNKVNRK